MRAGEKNDYLPQSEAVKDKCEYDKNISFRDVPFVTVGAGGMNLGNCIWLLRRYLSLHPCQQ